VAVFEVDTGGKLTLGEPNGLSPLSDESAEGAHNPSPGVINWNSSFS
jgi:hypothetical protein